MAGLGIYAIQSMAVINNGATRDFATQLARPA